MSQLDLLEPSVAPSMTLRPYQQDCVKAAVDGFGQFKSQIAILPTGSGKSPVMGWIAKAMQPCRVLCLAHRQELIEQNAQRIAQASGLSVSIEKAERHGQLSSDVVVGSVQTMLRRMDDFPANHFGLVIADEFHHYHSESTWHSIIRRFCPPAKLLGLTATPDKLMRDDDKRVFENIAYEIGLIDLIKQKYLAEIRILGLPLKIDISGVKCTHGDFKDDDLGVALEPYLDQIAAELFTHAKDRRTLVFLPLIATSRRFVDACLKVGMSARHVDGNSPDRSEILESFRRGEFQLLSNSQLVTEGVDIPAIDAVCVLRPTRSRTFLMQCLGRSLRLHPGKESALWIDFLYQHQKFSLVHPSHLLTDDDAEADRMTQMSFERDGASDPDDLLSDAIKERESALAKELKKQENRNKTAISVLELSVSLHQHGLFTFEPRVEWEGATPTDKQLDLIKKFGMDISTVKTKGQANRLISIILERRKKGLASMRQIRWLKKFGHPTPDTCTFKDASVFLDSRFGEKRS